MRSVTIDKNQPMDHITIPIPEGLPADQKRDLTGWLTQQAHEITGNGAAIDDDPQVRAEIVRRIRQGMADADAGRVISSTEARKRLDHKLGLTRDE